MSSEEHFLHSQFTEHMLHGKRMLQSEFIARYCADSNLTERELNKRGLSPFHATAA